MTQDIFLPAGPEAALKQAVAILVPAANERLRGKQRPKRRHSFAFGAKFEVRDHKAALRACERIATSYHENLEDAKDGTRPADFFGQFQKIEGLSKDLYKVLAGLRRDARFLLDTVVDDDQILFELLADARAEVKGLPPPDTNAPGHLAAELKSLSSYLKLYIPILRERLGGPKKQFRSNSPTVGAMTTASPVWRLIGEAWALFDRFPHLQASGNLGGDLGEFVRAIHFWVTGDSRRNYGNTVKKYGSYKHRQALLHSELDALNTPGQVQVGSRPSQRREIAAVQRTSDRRAAVEKELAELAFRLHFEFYPAEKRSRRVRH